MKKLNKMLQITGDIPFIYNRNTIYVMGTAINAHARAIDYLVEVIEGLEKKIDSLEKKTNSTKE